MSRILKRPMFRKGGPTNEGIVGMAQPREKFSGKGATDSQLGRNAEEYAGIAQKIMGPSQSSYDPQSRFLIDFGMDLMSRRPTGGGGLKGFLSTASQSGKKPVQDLYAGLDKQAAEQKQLKFFGLQQAFAQKLARDKAKGDQKYLRESEETRALEIVADNKLKVDKDGYTYNKSQAYALSQAILERLATRYIPKGFIEDKNLIKAIGLRDKSGAMVIMKDMEKTAEGFYVAPISKNKKRKSRYRNNFTYLNPGDDLLYIFDNGVFKPYPGLKPLGEYLSGK